MIHANVKGLFHRFDDFSDGYETFAPLKETEFHIDVDQDDDSGDAMLMGMEPWRNQFYILPIDNVEEDGGSCSSARFDEHHFLELQAPIIPLFKI